MSKIKESPVCLVTVSETSHLDLDCYHRHPSSRIDLMIPCALAVCFTIFAWQISGENWKIRVQDSCPVQEYYIIFLFQFSHDTDSIDNFLVFKEKKTYSESYRLRYKQMYAACYLSGWARIKFNAKDQFSSSRKHIDVIHNYKLSLIPCPMEQSTIRDWLDNNFIGSICSTHFHNAVITSAVCFVLLIRNLRILQFVPSIPGSFLQRKW